jgi:hypothetical protein
MACEAAVKKLEQLRNNLAHAQDILTTDWETVVQRCEFFQASITEPMDPIRIEKGTTK